MRKEAPSSFAGNIDKEVDGSFLIWTKPKTFIHSGRQLHAEVIEVPPGKTERISVGSEQMQLSADMVTRLTCASRYMDTLERAGRGVDCYTFGMVMLGGTFPSASSSLYDRRNINYSLSLANTQAVQNEGVDQSLPSMELLGMGTLDTTGNFWPKHVFVKTGGLYVSKLSKGPIVFTDLPGLAAFYAASHVAEVSSVTLTRKDSGELVGSYRRR